MSIIHTRKLEKKAIIKMMKDDENLGLYDQSKNL